MGFFTKLGDGGADVLPLAGLTKRRVRAMAAALGASERLSKKTPTADLETLTPQKPDEDWTSPSGCGKTTLTSSLINGTGAGL
jgi:NAD+ synthase